MPRPCHLVGHTHIIQYTWDHRNRLVKVEHRASYAAAVDRVVENAYDYQNRWVRRRLDADGDGHTDQPRIFAYDGNQIVLGFWRKNSQDLQIGHLRQRYLWGPAVDQILAEEIVDGGTDDLVQWTLADHLNTVRDIAKYDPGTDMTTVVNHLVYDAFGRVTSESDPAVDSLFLFTARPFDPDTGLQNNLNRWYDASVGRWLSEDPLEVDVNLYRYCANNPVLYVDPTGHWSSSGNGTYTHTGITRDAFNRAFPDTGAFGDCAAYILKRMIDANNGQDAGSWAFAGANQPGQQNYRHYCRDPGQSKEEADAPYTGYIAGEISTFRSAINPKNPTQANCDDALDAIGRVTHTWEDFYGHAIQNVNSGNRDFVWGDYAPMKLRRGDADHPGPDVVAPTFSWFSLPPGGEHGRSEPSSRDKPNGEARRRAAAVEFVAGKLRTLLSEWLNKCRCYYKG